MSTDSFVTCFLCVIFIGIQHYSISEALMFPCRSLFIVQHSVPDVVSLIKACVSQSFSALLIALLLNSVSVSDCLVPMYLPALLTVFH